MKTLPPIEETLLMMPAHKLASQIRGGSLKAAKVCQIYADRIKQVQPSVNAMTQDRFREALNEAKQIDQLLADLRQGKPESEFEPAELAKLRSPLLGVPVSIKESIKCAGMRNSCGLWSRRDQVASEEAQTVLNLRRAGLVPICTTNVPEGTLYWADCNNKIYGRTKNPFNLRRVTGASSGGEGALIGAGASLLGLGSDIGGSLRMPAHYCGIFSHKPSPFLVSPEGNFPEIVGARLRLFTLGPMCRYASDLRYFLKVIMTDPDGANPKQDTYFDFQPDDISRKRELLLQKLDQPFELSRIKLFYFDFNTASQLKGSKSLKVQSEFMHSQRELLDHFASKFNCQLEHLNLDKYFERILITWQCMLRSGGTPDRDDNFSSSELLDLFGIKSVPMEMLKLPFGRSKHTLESMLAIMVSSAVPNDRQRAYKLCERFEKLAAELKSEMEQTLGETGVLVLPTLPTTAYRHNVPLFKSADIRFPALLNVLQFPTTHATFRLDKKNNMPYGFSLAAKPFNDHLTIALAEEIEQVFGGWQDPAKPNKSPSLAKLDKKAPA